MEKIETEKLYVVKPSIVMSSESKKIGYNPKTYETEYKHIVKLQNNSKDINIAIPTMYNHIYRSLHCDACYFEGIDHNCVKGDYHLGIYKNDIMLLAQYLYMQRVSNPKWNHELEEYIISLKPYYDYDELSEIYKQMKKVKKNVRTKTLSNKYII